MKCIYIVVSTRPLLGKTCVLFFEWPNGKRKCLKFAIPMIWREQRSHSEYFSFRLVITKDINGCSQSKWTYPDIDFAKQPFARSVRISASLFVHFKMLLTECLVWFLCLMAWKLSWVIYYQSHPWGGGTTVILLNPEAFSLMTNFSSCCATRTDFLNPLVNRFYHPSLSAVYSG